MTEIYHGSWSPVRGDDSHRQPREQDPDHKYPATKPAGVLNEPVSGAYQIGVASETRKE